MSCNGTKNYPEVQIGMTVSSLDSIISMEFGEMNEDAWRRSEKGCCGGCSLERTILPRNSLRTGKFTGKIIQLDAKFDDQYLYRTESKPIPST
jgi:hypothetical protein